MIANTSNFCFRQKSNENKAEDLAEDQLEDSVKAGADLKTEFMAMVMATKEGFMAVSEALE